METDSLQCTAKLCRGDWFQFTLAGFGNAINWTYFDALWFVEVPNAFHAGIRINNENVWTFGDCLGRADRFAGAAVDAGFVNVKCHDGLLVEVML